MKFKRSNIPQRTKARRLVATWYAEQVREGNAAYRGDNQKVHVSVVNGEKRQPAAAQQPWDKPLTARGTEKVDINGVHIPSGNGTDPFAKYGRYLHDDYIRYVRACMANIMAACFEVHKALEMDAAQWGSDQIAAELGISVAKAESLVDDGLFGVQIYQSSHKPKRVEIDGKTQ